MGRINQEHIDGVGRCGRVGEDGLDREDKVSMGPWGRVSQGEGGRWRRTQPPNKEKHFPRFFYKYECLPNTNVKNNCLQIILSKIVCWNEKKAPRSSSCQMIWRSKVPAKGAGGMSSALGN
jgi:hypothetical protein